jgi:hypothetical protein
MGKNDNPSNEGYNAGKGGASSDDNPHSRGPASRMFDVTADVLSANVGKINQTADKNESDWEAGRQAGERDKNK